MESVHDVLARQAVTSVFQPIVDLDTGAVVAYEALARGPVGPLERPDALFAAARRSGRLADLDALCRRAAFTGAVELGLLAPLTLFVNVEPEVLDTAPLDDLLAVAEGAPGELRVVLEITERALATRPADLLRTVERVRALGWSVALDDVGAETLSLAFMPLLRPDVVKLDLRLVQDRPGPAIAEIMNAVNDHAEHTGAVVLAEGIETQAHLVMARALGARLGQGWMFGRPAAGPARGYPVAELPLPTATPPTGLDGSPFDCLPAGTTLRRSPKSLLIEVSKQLERQAMRLGETCVVAATFQEARHFTPSTVQRYRDLVARTGFVCALGEDLPVEPVPGVRGAALAPDDPVRGEWDVTVVSPHFTVALLARDLGDTARTGSGCSSTRSPTSATRSSRRPTRCCPAWSPACPRRRSASPTSPRPVRSPPRRGRRGCGRAATRSCCTVPSRPRRAASPSPPSTSRTSRSSTSTRPSRRWPASPSSRSSAATAGSCRDPTPTSPPSPASGPR
jgi:EAL domain-containing protein (putative c-di-GMP-specific phosphodiesterase class I)